MKANPVVQRHWPKAVAGLLAVALAAIFIRELPPAIRYIKMERM